MNFKEAIDKSCVIGDFQKEDYSREQYALVADQAQKILGELCSKIINVYPVTGNASYEMPPDFKRLVRVRRHKSAEASVYELMGNVLYIENEGNYDVYYEAVPGDINANIPDSYIFEIPEYAHFAIPYYIVYQLLKSTDTDTAQAALTEWNKYAALLTNQQKAVQKQIENRY